MKKLEKPESMKTPEEYTKYYSENGLMEKLSTFGRKAGIKLVYAALLLYYVLLSNNVPIKEKGLIIGALGYLILPIDLIPDMIPVAGFTDDLSALVYAINSVRNYIDEDIEQQAKEKLNDWFDDFDELELQLF